MNKSTLSPRPLVSIITPSFNQATYLEQTLTSVLGQDYPRLEYLVVDGSSTDGSVDIIKKYADKLTFWVSEKDSGQAEAINKGLSRARGKIIAWLNSDDTYLPGTISAAVKAFEANPDALLIYGDMLAVDEYGETINLLEYRQLRLEELLCFEIIGQPAVFMSREALERAGLLDPSYHYFLDHHLWLRIALQGPILHVKETWATARYHPEAKNRAKSTEFGREAFRILDWARTRSDFMQVLASVERRARASAFRVDARYLLDGGLPWQSLRSWIKALFIYPPVALKRLNIMASGLLEGTGLGAIRKAILARRKSKLT